MENQGTNEDDSQSDPHPEADIFCSQTTQNSGPEVGHDSKDWYLEDEKTIEGRDGKTKLFVKLKQLKRETQDNSEEKNGFQNGRKKLAMIWNWLHKSVSFWFF